MSIEKTNAIILSMIPFRESSSISTLLTHTYGKLSGVAKGIKRAGKASVPLERGNVIDVNVYIRPNRELQTLADIQIVSFYPSIRSSLEKTSLRDIALELLLKSVKDTEPHGELYFRSTDYLNQLEHAKGRIEGFICLWKYVLDLAQLSGFGTDFERCIQCGKKANTCRGGYLAIERGELLCLDGMPAYFTNECFVSPAMVKALCEDRNAEITLKIASPELLRLTKLLLAYCRLHMDIHHEFRSVAFMEDVLL